jgi:hypothetical protein
MRVPSVQLLLVVAAGAPALLSAGVLAQAPPEEGPVIVGERREGWKSFELLNVEAALDFYGRGQFDRQTQSGQPTITSRETLLRETLDLSGEMAIGHKNLLDITGAASFGLEDTWFTTTGADREHTTQFLNLYDVQGLILANGPAPTTIYARRTDTLLDRPFQSSLDITSAEQGVLTQINSAWAPTTLHYFHREDEQSDRQGDFNSSVTHDSFSAQSNLRITDSHHLDLDYAYDQVRELSPGFFDEYDRNEFNATDTIVFGTSQHELRTMVRLLDQNGLFAERDTRVDQLLTLRHTTRFETRYNVTYDDHELGEQDVRLLRGEASFRHRLFDSLVTTGAVGGQELSFSDGSTVDNLFVSGDADYTKKVPGGRLDASAGASYNALHNSGAQGTHSVMGQSVVFTDPLPIIITQSGIVRGSVVVRPSGIGVPYQTPRDYTVSYFSDRAEIRVNYPIGLISNGETLLIDYDVQGQPESDVDSAEVHVAFRYDLQESFLQGLGGYARYTGIQQSTNNPAVIVDNLNDVVLGVDYRRAGVALKAEWERHDSTISPFDATRLSAEYGQSIGRDSVLMFELSHEVNRFTEDNDRIDFDHALARWLQRLSPELQMELRLEYRHVRETATGRSDGFDQSLRLDWRRGQTSIYGSIRNAILEGGGGTSTSQLVEVGVRRHF